MSPLEASRSLQKMFEARSIAATQSPYDWKVCVRAVGAAADCARTIRVTGSAIGYLGALRDALQTLQDHYFDPEGEFTSGASEIGSIINFVEQMLRMQRDDGRPD